MVSLCLKAIARSLLKYSIAEFTVEEGIAKSSSPNIYKASRLTYRDSYPTDKIIEILFHDGLHYSSIDICKPYGEICAHD